MTRYDQPTINALYGDAYAINVGDALLGMGYRLLTQSNNMELVRLIAEAHASLCQGQGQELEWIAKPHPVGLDFTLDIIRHKTVPAFEVSLMLGLACTGNHQHLRPMLHDYSEALGIAYIDSVGIAIEGIDGGLVVTGHITVLDIVVDKRGLMETLHSDSSPVHILIQ